MSLPTSPVSPILMISGGSRGIGLAMVQTFRAAGWKVAACGATEESARSIPADLTMGCDVTNAKHVAEFVRRTVAELGAPTAVIANAGLAGDNQLDPQAPPELSDELWDKIIDVNLKGAYLLCKHALPHLPDGRGRIITVASILAHQGVPDASAYVAAKHGVLGFTRSLALYAAKRRITVNTISPGWTRTDMALQRMKEIGISEAGLRAGVPLGRFVEPREVAELALYLASESAAMITGQALQIDGGASV